MATSDKFDPYHKWFGIPPSQQPPSHYRLLGLELFEPDREVIDAAANQRIAYLQDIAAGPHGDASQRLLNEVAFARRCLLNPKNKAAYDQLLQQKAAAKPASPKVGEMVNGAAFAFESDLPEFEPAVDRFTPPEPRNKRAQPRNAAPKSRSKLPFVIGGAIGLLVVTAGIIIALNSGKSKPEPETPMAKRSQRSLRNCRKKKNSHAPPPGPRARLRRKRRAPRIR